MAVFHGGNLAGAAEQFGIPKQDWVDLSTGINPDAYPIPQLDSQLWGRLPDIDLVESLKKAACHAYGVPSEEFVIPVSGTQILLQILPRLFKGQKKVRVVGPTYKEHAYCWGLAGHDVCEVESLEIAKQDGEIIIVVNPNNPTGQTYQPKELVQLAKDQHSKGNLLIVDGAFMDCTPELEISNYGGTPGLVILRSFGKFYGLAGIRLGFVICSDPLAAQLRDGLGPWVVSGPALEIGRKALLDDQWAADTRLALSKSAQRLDEVLTMGGLNVIGGTSLFRYCHSENGHRIYEQLALKGILVRPFEDRPEYLRVGLPSNEDQWKRLSNAFQGI